MDLDEKLFSYFWKSKKYLFSEKQPEHFLPFEDMADRLTILSSLLAKTSIKVKKGNRMGGMVGDTIFFPPKVYLSQDQRLNELTYIHHTCFAICAKNLGFELKYDLTTPFRRLIATLVSSATVLKKIAQEYPALASEAKELYCFYGDETNLNKSIMSHSDSTIRPYLEDMVQYFIDEKSSLDPIFKITQERELTPQELIKYTVLIENKIKSKIKQKSINLTTFSLPPFISLLPLSVIQFKSSEAGPDEPAENSLTPETVIKTDPKDIVKRVNLKKEEDFNPATILMESTQTAELFKGGVKELDGSDDLEEHQEALKDLNVQEVVRSNKETKSIFQADIAYEVIFDEKSSADVQKLDKSHLYREWNYKKKKYLSDWCQLFESAPALLQTSDDSQNYLNKTKIKNKKHIKDLRHKIEKLTLSRRWKNRQVDGEELDLDSVIDGLTSIKSGVSPDDKFYLSKRKHTKDVSILILLDASLSSDSWIDGERVLDISKESIVVIQEALVDLFDNTAIMAFNGNTRQRCQYYTIKEFKDSWKDSISRLMSIEPSGYTRIGTALRHSIFKMEKVKSDKKMIILLSDGKPTDYDFYEGKYGIQDVRQVLREAKQKNINIFSLAVDQQAKFYFPQMFGKNNFRVLKKASFLPDCFIQLFSKLI